MHSYWYLSTAAHLRPMIPMNKDAMEHPEMVALIRAGVAGPGGVWADLGAGTGNFTRALAELLGPGATIYALDRDARALAAQRAAAPPGGSTIVARQADVTRALELPPLDGALMANLLHFVRDQAGLLARVRAALKPGGRLVLVEYEQATAIPWVPHPVPFARFAELAQQAGFRAPTQVGYRRSPSSGRAMYAALALSPAAEPPPA